MGAAGTKLSIITINFNNRQGLEKTVKSVTNQTFGNFDYIVIDGGSTDGSTEIIKNYESNISYWVSEKDKGIYNAMNKGIAIAKGEYLLFLNSGDYLDENDSLENALGYIKDEMVCSCDIRVYDSKTNRYEIWPAPEMFGYSFFLNTTLNHQSTFIHSSLFRNYGFYNESNIVGADWEFFFLVLGVHSQTYKKIPVVLSVYNLDGFSANLSPEMKAIQKRDGDAVIDRFVPRLLKPELYDYLELKQFAATHRYRTLRQIEKSRFLRRLTTVYFFVVKQWLRMSGKIK
jgi:glycosyltransferase involved in cell wall biosynthesis